MACSWLKNPEPKYKLLRVLEGLLFSNFGIAFFLKIQPTEHFLWLSLVLFLMMTLAVTNTIDIFKPINNIKWVATSLNILVICFSIQFLLYPQLTAQIFTRSFFTINFYWCQSYDDVLSYFKFKKVYVSNFK